MVFMKYLAWRVKRFLRGHCPGQKMSCIGKYKRNVINFKQTIFWLLCWQVNLLLDFPFQSFLEADQVLSKQSKFFIWTTKGVFMNECSIFLGLASEVPDTKSRLVRPGSFYVRSPVLEPRRPWQSEREQLTVFEGRANKDKGKGKGKGKKSGLPGNRNEPGNEEKPGCSSRRAEEGGITHSWSLNQPAAGPSSGMPSVYDTCI